MGIANVNEIGIQSKNGGVRMKSADHIKPNEVGCYNCTRWRTGSKRCDICVGFSQFKNIGTLNIELKEKGLDYLCVSSIEELRKRK